MPSPARPLAALAFALLAPAYAPAQRPAAPARPGPVSDVRIPVTKPAAPRAPQPLRRAPAPYLTPSFPAPAFMVGQVAVAVPDFTPPRAGRRRWVPFVAAVPLAAGAVAFARRRLRGGGEPPAPVPPDTVMRPVPPVAVVPEPAPLALLGAGFAAGALLWRAAGGAG